MKKDIKKEEVKINRLTPEQYWEWRTTVTELQLIDKEKELVKRDAYIDELQILLRKNNLRENKEKLAELIIKESRLRKEYGEYLEKLEKTLGFSMKDKIIDPYTFEVKEC